MTTETTDHPGGYQGAMDEFYAECAARLAAHLDAGRDVVVLAEGDPLFYGSYMHMHKRLARPVRDRGRPGRHLGQRGRGRTRTAAGRARRGPHRAARHAAAPTSWPTRLAAPTRPRCMKLGRTFGACARRSSRPGGSTRPGTSSAPPPTAQRDRAAGRRGPGLGAVLLARAAAEPDRTPRPRRDRPAPDRRARARSPWSGSGPAGREWLTPEARAALAAADDLVGYGPYLDRVPRPIRASAGTRSDNRVEAERAAFALDLARAGRRVAVVSSGDPGVFAMASRGARRSPSSPQYADVAGAACCPGMTAAQAVASRVGAPLGHDYCVLSLSDRLKPWEVDRASG